MRRGWERNRARTHDGHRRCGIGARHLLPFPLHVPCSSNHDAVGRDVQLRGLSHLEMHTCTPFGAEEYVDTCAQRVHGAHNQRVAGRSRRRGSPDADLDWLIPEALNRTRDGATTRGEARRKQNAGDKREDDEDGLRRQDAGDKRADHDSGQQKAGGYGTHPDENSSRWPESQIGLPMGLRGWEHRSIARRCFSTYHSSKFQAWVGESRLRTERIEGWQP